MRFEGTKDYVATDDLTVAVNAAVTLERPLLVKRPAFLRSSGFDTLMRQLTNPRVPGIR